MNNTLSNSIIFQLVNDFNTTFRTVNQVERIRILACEEAVIYRYFDLLEEVRRDNNIKWDRWYNEDEAGFGKKLALRYVILCNLFMFPYVNFMDSQHAPLNTFIYDYSILNN